MSPCVRLDRIEGVLSVALDRPSKKNALNRDMYCALTEALVTAQQDPSIRVVVLSGSGGDFTAGNDLGDFLNFLESPETFPALTFVRTLALFPKPIVAAVTGAAIGIGTSMLFHCDLVFASSDAIFSMPFINLGLVPEAGVSLLAPMRLGRARATQALLLGEAFSARQALEMGLVNAVTSPGGVKEMAIEASSRLAEKDPFALNATRRLMRGEPEKLLAQIDKEAELFVSALQAPSTQARLKAFFKG
ncbi:MAG: enoyl-CoA hydratase [Alphaproteobacteria bacterium]|nr:enoyl-CoA hydratase [Alphaproteobacteria bacterium]